METSLMCVDNGFKGVNQHRWGPGVREIYALHYIVSGSGYLETLGKQYRLSAGDSFLVYPQTEVWYYPNSEDPWSYIWVDFRGSEAKEYIDRTQFCPQEPVLRKGPINLKPYFEIFENHPQYPYESVRNSGRLRILLSYYMEYFPKDQEKEIMDYGEIARGYIEKNYWKPDLQIEDIAAFVNIDRSYLFRKFKECTGRSMKQYLSEYRMERACELLRHTNLSVKSVSHSVGYQDPLYFSKVFSKLMSISPSGYIKQYREGL